MVRNTQRETVIIKPKSVKTPPLSSTSSFCNCSAHSWWWGLVRVFGRTRVATGQSPNSALMVLCSLLLDWLWPASSQKEVFFFSLLPTASSLKVLCVSTRNTGGAFTQESRSRGLEDLTSSSAEWWVEVWPTLDVEFWIQAHLGPPDVLLSVFSGEQFKGPLLPLLPTAGDDLVSWSRGGKWQS